LGLKAWSFTDQSAVQVGNFVTTVAHPFHGMSQNMATVQILCGGNSRGKMGPDVSFGQSSVDGIGNGVNQDIGITLPTQAEFRVKFNSSQDQLSAGDNPVRIISKAYAHEFCLSISL